MDGNDEDSQDNNNNKYHKHWETQSDGDSDDGGVMVHSNHINGGDLVVGS